MFFNLILEQKENKASKRVEKHGIHSSPRKRRSRSDKDALDDHWIPACAGMSGEDALAFSQSALALLFVFKPVDCRA